jgi:hypothetical protein
MLVASIKTYIKTRYRAYIPKELCILYFHSKQSSEMFDRMITQSGKAPEGIPTRIENNSPLSHIPSIICGLSISPF